MIMETIKDITITDLGFSSANETRSLRIDIAQLAPNSSLLITYGDDTKSTLFGCPGCDHPFPDAVWKGDLNFISGVVNHTYETEGTYYFTVLGWNLVSELEVFAIVVVSSVYCGPPILSIRNGSPIWRSPRRVYRKDHVIIEAVTYLGGTLCQVDTIQRSWEIQQLNITTGHYLQDEVMTLSDLPITHPGYVANTSEIHLPPFYPLDFGLFRFTHKVNVLFTNGEWFDLYTEEHVYVHRAPLEVVILAGDTTHVWKGHGQMLLLLPDQLSIDPDVKDDGTSSVSYEIYLLVNW